MSNLSSSVKFDVLRGWPNGGAIEDSFKVAAGKTLTEGQLVILTNVGGVPTVDEPAAVAAEAAATGATALRLVIQGNDQYDAKFVGKAVVLRGEVTIKTEKFIAGAYVPGELVTISVGAGTKGYIAKRTAANEQVVGVVEEYNSTAGTLVVALAL